MKTISRTLLKLFYLVLVFSCSNEKEAYIVSKNELQEEFRKPKQIFEVPANVDTVLFTKSGYRFSVKSSSEKIKYKIEEYTSVADLILFGLSSKTKTGFPLETKGMFFIQAFDSLDNPILDLKNQIKLEIDAFNTGLNSEYLIFDGVEDDGEIFWGISICAKMRLEIDPADGKETFSVPSDCTSHLLFYSYNDFIIEDTNKCPTDLGWKNIDRFLEEANEELIVELPKSFNSNSITSIFFHDVNCIIHVTRSENNAILKYSVLPNADATFFTFYKNERSEYVYQYFDFNTTIKRLNVDSSYKKAKNRSEFISIVNSITKNHTFFR